MLWEVACQLAAAAQDWECDAAEGRAGLSRLMTSWPCACCGMAATPLAQRRGEPACEPAASV